MSTERTALRNCTRWTKTDRGPVADLFGGFDIRCSTPVGYRRSSRSTWTTSTSPRRGPPSSASGSSRAAALADGDRAIRRAPGGGQ